MRKLKGIDGIFGVNFDDEPQKKAEKVSDAPENKKECLKPEGKAASDAKEAYDKKTKGVKAITEKAGAIIFGALSAGLLGIDYAIKANAYRDAVAKVEYLQQVEQIKNDALLAMYNGAAAAGDLNSTGHPFFDNNDFLGYYYPEMNGKFSEFAAQNPELAEKIMATAKEYGTLDSEVMQQWIADRGFASPEAYQNWITTLSSTLFTDTGIAPTATKEALDLYALIQADSYNYVGNAALEAHKDEIYGSGMTPTEFDGIKFVEQPILDDAGQVIDTSIVTELTQEITANGSWWDAENTGVAVAMVAFMGIGAYCLADKVISYVKDCNSKSSHTDEEMIK